MVAKVLRTFNEEGDAPAAGGDAAVGGTPEVGPGGEAPATVPDAYDGPEFLKELSGELRENPSLKKYNSWEALAAGHVAAQKFIGNKTDNMVEIPEDPSIENRIAILQKLGAPEGPDEYTLEAAEDVLPFVAPETDLAKGFMASAARLGLFPDQMQGLYTDVVGLLADQHKQFDTDRGAQQEEQISQLKKDWGDAYDRNLNAASYAATQLDIHDALEETGAGANPDIVRAMAKIGQMLAEETGAAGKNGVNFGAGETPAELQDKINALNDKMGRAKTDHEMKAIANELTPLYLKLVESSSE